MVLIWKLLRYDFWRGLWFESWCWEYGTLSAAHCEHDTLSAVIVAAVTVAAVTIYVSVGVSVVIAVVIIATDVKSVATATVTSAAAIIASFSAAAFSSLLFSAARWEYHTLSVRWEYHTLSGRCWEYDTLSRWCWEYDAVSHLLRWVSSYSQRITLRVDIWSWYANSGRLQKKQQLAILTIAD